MEELDIWGRTLSAEVYDFKWAWKTLRAGGKVRRAKWAEGAYIFVNQHNILVAHLSTAASLHCSEVPHRPDWQDLSATDWQAA